MADARQVQLGLAVRSNRGRTLATSFQEATAAALGMRPEDLRLVDLPATDAALAELLARRAALEAGRALAEVFVSLRTNSRNVLGVALDLFVITWGVRRCSSTVALANTAAQSWFKAANC